MLLGQDLFGRQQQGVMGLPAKVNPKPGQENSSRCKWSTLRVCSPVLRATPTARIYGARGAASPLVTRERRAGDMRSTCASHGLGDRIAIGMVDGSEGENAVDGRGGCAGEFGDEELAAGTEGLEDGRVRGLERIDIFGLQPIDGFGNAVV
ncbi:uncharacterized protein DS421_5g136210 [Arachis hypogaea]|nr:uncharacterized protein DS421_5g136210 [Arachis hypogaea]